MAYYLIVDVRLTDEWPQSFRIVDAPTLVDAIKTSGESGAKRLAVIPLPSADFDVDFTQNPTEPTIRPVIRPGKGA